MSDKRNKIFYYVFTGLLTLMMLPSAIMYFARHEYVAEVFTHLGFPTYIIYPLALAKIVGLLTIWLKKSGSLVEWAYAGFFFDLLLALVAHKMAGDGELIPALAGIVVLFISYFSSKRVFNNH